jgi:hypothetical protein
MEPPVKPTPSTRKPRVGETLIAYSTNHPLQPRPALYQGPWGADAHEATVFGRIPGPNDYPGESHACPRRGPLFEALTDEQRRAILKEHPTVKTANPYVWFEFQPTDEASLLVHLANQMVAMNDSIKSQQTVNDSVVATLNQFSAVLEQMNTAVRALEARPQF